METVLIVSSLDNGINEISTILKSVNFRKISVVKTCGEARRIGQECPYDLYIINSPVNTQTGEDLAKELVTNSESQVIITVKNDAYDYITSKVVDLGIITLSKPFTKSNLLQVLNLSKAMYARLSKVSKQNSKLSQKLDDIKIVNRAKCVLISYLNMSETEAHKYIEKHAMDTRLSKREIALNILKTYEL